MYKVIFLVVMGVFFCISLSSGYGLKRYPSNRMLDFNWPEPDEHILKFPHEKYCHYYYKRESGEIFTIRKCLPGKIFDYHNHDCMDKHSAQCWSHRYGKHAIHDHIHSQWRKHFKCPFPNGNYPDIYDCDKYIVCLDGKPHYRHCSPNQQFDKKRRHCVYAAVCANSTDAALVSHMCPYSSGNFSHPEDCSKYYNCHKSQPTLMSCEKNKLYNKEDRVCKDKESVRCGDRPSPYRKTLITKPLVKSTEINDFHPSISSENIDKTIAETKKVVSINQSDSTNFMTSMPSEVTLNKSANKDKATVEETLHSDTTQKVKISMSPTKSNQSKATMEIPISMSASNITKSTVQLVAIDNAHSSISSSVSESTAKTELTRNSQSSMLSSSTPEASTKSEITENSNSSQLPEKNSTVTMHH